MNKYQSKILAQVQNQYLDYVVDLIFQETNRLFVLSSENIADRKRHAGCYLFTMSWLIG